MLDINDFPFSVWNYLTVVTLVTLLGLRIVYSYPKKAQRDEVIALYDLLWIFAGIIGIFATFSQIGKAVWQIKSAEDTSIHARFLESIGDIATEAIVSLNCRNTLVNPKQEMAKPASYAAYIATRPCIWARNLNQQRTSLQQANLDIGKFCSSGAKYEMQQHLFKSNANNFFDACGVSNLSPSSCSKAYCTKQNATNGMHLLLLLKPEDIRPDATLKSKLEQQFNARSPLNKQTYDSLHPLDELMTIFTLMLVSILFGLRISKAIYDYCKKIEDNNKAFRSRGLLRLLMKFRLYKA